MAQTRTLQGKNNVKIYTKSGDDGKTGLFHGPRVSKDDARIEAYGTVDELCSVIGLARSFCPPVELDAPLEQIQHQLFALGAELATPNPEESGTALLRGEDTSWIEQKIDSFEENLAPLTSFILPGGTQLAASLHHARVVCRRAERRVVTLSRATELSNEAVSYLNRVGDLLFVLARTANAHAGKSDVQWQKPST